MGLKNIYIAFVDEFTMYQYLEEIYTRINQISTPVDFKHETHVSVNSNSKGQISLIGLPEEWIHLRKIKLKLVSI